MIFEHFIVAKNSSIDHESNSLSVFEFIEDLEINALPGGQPILLALQGIAVFRRGSEKGALNAQVRFRILNPENNEIINQTLNVPMQENHRRTRIRFNFPCSISSPGRYRFSLEYDDVEREIETVITINRKVP